MGFSLSSKDGQACGVTLEWSHGWLIQAAPDCPVSSSSWYWPCGPTVSLALACLTPQGFSAAHQAGGKVTWQSLPALCVSSPRSWIRVKDST